MAETNKKNLKEWLKEFYEDTSTLSGIIRNISFAGIGLIWIFRNSSSNCETLTNGILPKELRLSLTFIVVGIICDVTQYLWRGVNVYIFWKIKDTKYINGRLSEKDVADVTMPSYILIGTWFFFIAKIFFVTFAYYLIYFFLVKRL